MPAPDHALFTAAQLRDYLRTSVTDDQGAVAENVVWGWLQPHLKLTERPDELPPGVWPRALQLGAIAFTNPELLESYALGTERSVYSRENYDRLLAEVDDLVSGGTGATAPPRPRGRFPKPEGYPDPARVLGRYRHGQGY